MYNRQSLALFGFLLVGCLLAVSLIASAQREDVKLRTDLVLLEAQALRRDSGQPVDNLTKDDLEVFEDGVQQEITHFEAGATPLSLILLIDTVGCLSPVSEIVGAAQKALDHLHPSDEVALMSFDKQARLVEDFTRDKQLIADRVANLDTNHDEETHAVGKAVAQALQQMRRATNHGRKVILIVMGDLPALSRSAEEEALEQLYESDCVLYGVLVQTGETRVANGFLNLSPPGWIIKAVGRYRKITNIARATGGEAFTVKGRDLPEQLPSLMDQMRRYYVLGYVPTQPQPDRQVRKIRVKVSPTVKRREGDVVVRVRDGYIPPVLAPPPSSQKPPGPTIP